MSVPSSGENSVAPPVPPTRNSLNRLLPNVERNDSDVVHRVDCWLPVVSEARERQLGAVGRVGRRIDVAIVERPGQPMVPGDTRNPDARSATG